MAASILGPEADPSLSPAQVALAEVRTAAWTDWRAAAWLVERAPETRETWSDPARAAAIRNATIAQVLEAIEAANLDPVTERLLLLENDRPRGGPAPSGGRSMTAATGSEPGGPTAETLARSAEVLSWLVEGLGRPEIHARARERWELAPRSTDRLIAHARGQLREAWDLQREEVLAVLLTRCDRIYREAMACANHGAALGAINAAARLAQL